MPEHGIAYIEVHGTPAGLLAAGMCADMMSQSCTCHNIKSQLVERSVSYA